MFDDRRKKSFEETPGAYGKFSLLSAMEIVCSFHMGHGFQFAFCVRLQEGIPTIHELIIHP